jgi:hypothetical protein
LLECGVEKFSGRADEWLALLIFLVAGLFTDKQDSRFAGAFAEDGLRGVFVEAAGFAVFRADASLVNGFGDGERRRRRSFGWRGCSSVTREVFRARFGFGNGRHGGWMRVTSRRCPSPGGVCPVLRRFESGFRRRRVPTDHFQCFTCPSGLTTAGVLTAPERFKRFAKAR